MSEILDYSALDKKLAAICKDGLYSGMSKRMQSNVEFIPTVSLAFNKAFGGIAPGRIYEIFGPQGSGKTTLALMIALSFQVLDKSVMWLDIEGVYTDEYAESMGLDPRRLRVAAPDTMNQSLEAVRVAADSGIDLVILDSVAALVPKEEFDKDIGGAQIAAKARILSATLPQLISICRRSNTTIIFINQERACNLTGGYGPKSTTTGGGAIPYYASVRLDINRSEWVGDKDDKQGFKMKALAVKNKVSKPFAKAEFLINFVGSDRPGIDLIFDRYNLGVELDLIAKRGSWISYKDYKAQGEDNFISLMVSNAQLMDDINKDISSHIDKDKNIEGDEQDGKEEGDQEYDDLRDPSKEEVYNS